ncbi:MAG: hypothetical protein NZ700_15085 [Gemmataceae bacterium]|nr:hypothetical protein [Gemmataceae bacterium]MDW8264424.1 hypothetical protein [Gemmataceae bacterium]
MEDPVAITGPEVILTLKIAVSAVTLLLLASLVALLRGNYRLHGRINVVFFTLTLIALFGLEVVVRYWNPEIFDYFDPQTKRRLMIHLCFSVPAAIVMPAMLYTGLTHRRGLHLVLAAIFGILWIGTCVTGLVFLH